MWWKLLPQDYLTLVNLYQENKVKNYKIIWLRLANLNLVSVKCSKIAYFQRKSISQNAMNNTKKQNKYNNTQFHSPWNVFNSFLKKKNRFSENWVHYILIKVPLSVKTVVWQITRYFWFWSALKTVKIVMTSSNFPLFIFSYP